MHPKNNLQLYKLIGQVAYSQLHVITISERGKDRMWACQTFVLPIHVAKIQSDSKFRLKAPTLWSEPRSEAFLVDWNKLHVKEIQDISALSWPDLWIWSTQTTVLRYQRKGFFKIPEFKFMKQELEYSVLLNKSLYTPCPCLSCKEVFVTCQFSALRLSCFWSQKIILYTFPRPVLDLSASSTGGWFLCMNCSFQVCAATLGLASLAIHLASIHSQRNISPPFTTGLTQFL